MSQPNPPRSGGGCFSKLLFLCLLLPLMGVGAAFYIIAQPQNLEEIGGYKEVTSGQAGKNLPQLIEESIKRDAAISFTETEVNQWLAGNLSTRQGGELADKVSLDRVWVRLQDGHAEVVMERKIMGRSFTSSIYVKVNRIEGPDGPSTELETSGGSYFEKYPAFKRGGRLGKLEVPQAFVLLMMPGYDKLAEAFPQELTMAFKNMARVRFEDHRITFDPHEPLEKTTVTPTPNKRSQVVPDGFIPRQLK